MSNFLYVVLDYAPDVGFSYIYSSHRKEEAELVKNVKMHQHYDVRIYEVDLGAVLWELASKGMAREL